MVDEYVDIKDSKVDYDSLYARADLISRCTPSSTRRAHMIDDDSISKDEGFSVIAVVSPPVAHWLVDSSASSAGNPRPSRRAADRRLRGGERQRLRDREDEILRQLHHCRASASPNVVVTSHQAFFTKEALVNARVTLDNAQAFALTRHRLRAAPGRRSAQP